MKSAKLLLGVFVVLFSACVTNDDEVADTGSNDIQSTKILFGTWISDSLRYSENKEKSAWYGWENTEPDTITFSTDSAYFGFTDKGEVSGFYQYTGNKDKMFFDEVGLTWNVRPCGKLFLQFSSPQETDQYLYHKIK